MQRDRAWRRAQRQRKINRIQRWMKDRHWWYGPQTDREDTNRHYAEMATRRHSAPQGCSSYCCGNPRKWFKAATLAEIRFADHCLEAFNEEDVRQHVRRPHKE